ncbi:hypothetical protein JCM10450v2_000222 [Rhodotorula kratochvilovae]
MASLNSSVGLRQPSKVCTPCQRRKVSCDLGRPACSACRKYGKARPAHECTYEEGAPLPAEATHRRASSAEPAETFAGRTRAENKALQGAEEPVQRAEGTEEDQEEHQEEGEGEVPATGICDGPSGCAHAGEPEPEAEVEPAAIAEEPGPPVDIPPSLRLPPLPSFPNSDEMPSTPALPITAQFDHGGGLDAFHYPRSPSGGWFSPPYSPAYCPRVYHPTPGATGLNANLSELGLEEYEFAFSSPFSPYHFGPFP